MNTLEQLNKFIAESMIIFPLKPESKVPLSTEGFKDAVRITSDRLALDFYSGKTSNWGVSLGDSDLSVIDVDTRNGGSLEIHEDYFLIISSTSGYSRRVPVTRLVKTGGGGNHLYYKGSYKLPKALAPGLDLKSEGGYVVLPGSTHPNGNLYEWENDLDFAEFPIEIIEKKVTYHSDDDFFQVVEALNRLKKDRAENYDTWIQVGMILHTLGDGYLPQWDSWSKQSGKYEPGKCAQKWVTFRDDGGLTVNNLFSWAEEDSKGIYIRPGPKNAKPSDYMNTLHTMGYSFSLNKMNDRVYVNGNLLSDALEMHMMTRLRENNYKTKEIFEDAVVSEAYEHQFHPIEDYLNSLVWDGEDHIQKLCSYFKDTDDIFPLLLRKWLVGAVNKILGKKKGEQNPMLVLDGKQGKGKSRFVWWLGSALPEFYKASPIYPEDKDHVIDSASFFVWEVEELGSTIRKADREALKAFITREYQSFRAPFGRYTINKPVTSSYIGTINNENGFLSDPTGNRRFRICTIEEINWNYSNGVDVNQVWAQAVLIFKDGETSNLTKEENEKIDKVKSRFEVEDSLEYFINDYFNIEPERKDVFTSASEIYKVLKDNYIPMNGSDKQNTDRIAAILIKSGCENKQKRVKAGANPMRVWLGVSSKDMLIKENIDKLLRGNPSV